MAVARDRVAKREGDPSLASIARGELGPKIGVLPSRGHKALEVRAWMEF